MGRLGMGLVGPGFVAAHHIDAVRRLGFVDVVAIVGADSTRARARAGELGVARVYDTVDELVADPEIHVVHNTTPNHLHGSVIRAAIGRGKHVVSEKPLAVSAAEAHELWGAAEQAGVVHAVTFNYRGNPLVQQARAMIAAGEIGRPHFVHGAYLQDWLLKPTDFSWRLEPDKGGASSAFADIGSHWCDLAQHVTGQRIVAVLADCATVVPTRQRPSASRAAFSEGSPAPSEVEGAATGEPYAVTSEDLATILVRFEGGAKGAVSIGQVCAGHKNDLWLEVNASTTSLRWRQEQQNELWIGRRDGANMTLAKDPALLAPTAARYAHLPGGHQEAWADAFTNVMRDIYACIRNPRDPRPPAMATFEDGYRVACLVDAVLESHARGGVWTPVPVAEMVGGRR